MRLQVYRLRGITTHRDALAAGRVNTGRVARDRANRLRHERRCPRGARECDREPDADADDQYCTEEAESRPRCEPPPHCSLSLTPGLQSGEPLTRLGEGQ